MSNEQKDFDPTDFDPTDFDPTDFDPTRTLRELVGACREWNRSDDPDARDAARADAIDALEELLEWVRSGEDLPNPDGVAGHLDT